MHVSRRLDRRMASRIALALAGAIASPALAQNLVVNGGFEETSVAASVSGCCAFIEPLPAGARALPAWSIGGGGGELRGRDAACEEGPADGGRWLRLGQGSAGGSIAQAVATREGVVHAIRFTRWVESPEGAMVPLRVVAPGFTITMFLPADGPACTPELAARTIIEFTAVAEASLLRFETFGGPPDRHVLLDSVEVVEVADCDGDGLIDGFAILDGLVEDLDVDGVPDACRCRSDFDGDGSVGGLELGQLFSSWGETDPVADLDGDGIVGSSDLSILLGDWGACR